jgi:hypothetical protein
VKTPAQRQRERREARLQEVEREVKAGSLIIRQMTETERAQYPPRERSAKRRR